MAQRRDGESVKMQVSRTQFHFPARASVRGDCMSMSVGRARFDIQFILEAQDQQVPGAQSQRRRLGATPQYITKPPGAIGFALISNVHIDVQSTVLASDILGLSHDCAWCRAWTYLRESCGTGTDRPSDGDHRDQEPEQNEVNRALGHNGHRDWNGLRLARSAGRKLGYGLIVAGLLHCALG
jgi:hypothetical protein